MKDHRLYLLKDASVKKAVNHMSIPAIIGFLVMAIYNIVDTMFVAWLGTEATGATQVVFPIMMLISSIGLTFGIGGGSYISRLLGGNQKHQANKVTIVALLSSLSVGLLFTLIALTFIESLLIFFGAQGQVLVLSKDYGLYIILGSCFTMGNMTMNNLLRGEGSVKLSMIAMVIGAFLNIILDPIFIFVFDLGIQGAAMATLLSQMTSFLILLSYYLRKITLLSLQINCFQPSKEIYVEIFKVGIPTLFRQVLVSVSLGLLNQNAMVYGGDTLLAAIGLVIRVYMLPMYILIGIGQGFQPVAGYNFGAHNRSRVLDALKYTVFLSMALAGIFCLAFQLFSNAILNVFQPSPQVLDYGMKGLKIYGFSLIFLSLTNTITVFFQAIGKGKESLILSISRQGIFFIPILYIFPKIFGVQGILFSQFSADLLTGLLSFILFYVFMKKTNYLSLIIGDIKS
jgi:putative MATE family efflux protein